MAELTTARYRPAAGVLILIGVIGGLLSGSFGVGGGIVIVPLLMLFARFDQRSASATSLLAIVPSGLAAGATYFAQGYVDFVVVLAVSFGAVVGSLVGSLLLRRLPIWWLRWGFILLMLGVAARLALYEPERGAALPLTVGLVLAYLAIGLVTGLCSGIFGIGGAVVAVPALITLFGMSDLFAKGSTLLVMVVTSTTGTLTHRRSGLVDLRSAAIVGIVAAAASVLGAVLAVGMPPRLSSVLFAGLLVLVAVQLIVRAVRDLRRPSTIS